MVVDTRQPQSLWPLGLVPLFVAAGASFLNDVSRGYTFLIAPFVSALICYVLIRKVGVAALAVLLTIIYMLLAVAIALAVGGV